MNYKIKKLDSRFNGYPHFSHYISIIGLKDVPLGGHPARVQAFVQLREWFWTTFGPSRELKLMGHFDPTCADLTWAWDSGNTLRIYVQEKELHWFLLKWAQ